MQLLAVTLLMLSGCASGPSALTAPPPQAPRLPALVLDKPERDWQEEMQRFLQGTLPMQPGLELP